jgi:cyclopropane-fatty-acyl-phospholipid synthase
MRRPAIASILAQPLIHAVERGRVPDPVVRWGIRRLVGRRLAEHPPPGPPLTAAIGDFVRELDRSPIALVPDVANEQHYEVPPEFFREVLGARLKYSSGYWPAGVSTLDEAESAMLALSCERAQLADGQRVLELGCGWGSLTLWMAEQYPNSDIVAVSNSTPQRRFIEEACAGRRLGNVTVVTADMNDFEAVGRFDRVVSVEMFEHMRNYRELMRRISTWLRPGGSLFVHLFCHRTTAYPFVDRGPGDWMARHFFTGGLMPSDDLLPSFQDHLRLVDRWRVDGRHYERTADAWLANLDRSDAAVRQMFARVYGSDQALRWRNRWRLFFLSVSELFGYRGGQEWQVAHYRFVRQSAHGT